MLSVAHSVFSFNCLEKIGIINSFSLFRWMNYNSQMDSNVQEFYCSPWSFPEMQRCLSYVTCSYSFLDRSVNCCASKCISSCYIFFLVFRFHGRKWKYFFDIIRLVYEKHGDLVYAHAQQTIFQGGASVYLWYGLIITSSLGLGLFFEKLPLPHGVIQLGVGIAEFPSSW